MRVAALDAHPRRIEKALAALILAGLIGIMIGRWLR